MLVPGMPFGPSQLFGCKAGAQPSEAPLSCFTLGWTSGLTHKNENWLEKLTRDKHLSSSQTSLITDVKVL